MGNPRPANSKDIPKSIVAFRVMLKLQKEEKRVSKVWGRTTPCVLGSAGV